jgi:hypothetical protein
MWLPIAIAGAAKERKLLLPQVESRTQPAQQHTITTALPQPRTIPIDALIHHLGRLIESISNSVGIRACDIRAIVELQHPDTVSIRRVSHFTIALHKYHIVAS